MPGRLFLRLHQSRIALLAAAGTLAEQHRYLSEELVEMSHRRHQSDARLADLAVGAGIGWRTRRDIAGRLHRIWIKAVGTMGPGAVLDECNRSETRLLRAVTALRHVALPPEMELHLSRVGDQLERDIEWLKARRVAHDSITTLADPDSPAARVGRSMPSFRAPSSTGQTLDSESYRGKLPLVGFFVPDSTSRRSGRRIGEFNRNLGRFGQLRTQVIGIVPETAKRVRRQAESRGYNLPLLADPDESIHAAFGIGEAGSSDYATFITDRDGTIARVYRSTGGPGHAHQVLASIRALKADGPVPMDPKPSPIVEKG